KLIPLPTLRFPTASTSSLVFFGLTVSCCWTGFSWLFWVCSEGGGTFVGSCVGGGLCAQALLAASAPTIITWLVRRRISCITPPPARFTIHPFAFRAAIPLNPVRCGLSGEGFL